MAKYSGQTCLKQVIAEYGASPGQITREMLSLPETLNGENILKKFKQNLFLIFCAEIFRYFPVEEASTNYVKQLPFAIALSMGLEMLCSGEIELEDLFDHDADLGLPTGVKILDNAQSVGIKFKNLLTQSSIYRSQKHWIAASLRSSQRRRARDRR